MLCIVDMDRGFVNTIHTRSLDGPRKMVTIRSHPLEVSVLPSALACHNAVNGIIRESREAKAVELAKVYLQLNLRFRFLTDAQFTVTRQLKLLAEVDSATTKQDIKDIIAKLSEILSLTGVHLIYSMNMENLSVSRIPTSLP